MANVISSYNSSAMLQQRVCEILAADEYLQSLSVLFIPENSKDIDYQIKNSLAKQGLACVVITPKLEYIGHNGVDIAWDCKDLTLLVSEYTPINRASNKLSCVTGLDLLNYCANYLGGPQCAGDFGAFCPKTIEQGEDNGLLVTKATFDCTIMGLLSGIWTWDGTHVILSPFALETELCCAVSSLLDIISDISASSGTLSDYYTKSETSSAVELDLKLSTFVTHTEVVPSNFYTGYANDAVGSLVMYGTRGVLASPDKNILFSLDKSDNDRPMLLTLDYAAWKLTNFNNTTYSPAEELKWQGYVNSVIYTYTVGPRTITGSKRLDSYAWHNDNKTFFVLATGDDSTGYTPTLFCYRANNTNNWTFYDTTFSTNYLSVETLNGQSGVVVCTRDSTGKVVTSSHHVAWQDELSAKADLSSLDELDSKFVLANLGTATNLRLYGTTIVNDTPHIYADLNVYDGNKMSMMSGYSSPEGYYRKDAIYSPNGILLSSTNELTSHALQAKEVSAYLLSSISASTGNVRSKGISATTTLLDIYNQLDQDKVSAEISSTQATATVYRGLYNKGSYTTLTLSNLMLSAGPEDEDKKYYFTVGNMMYQAYLIDSDTSIGPSGREGMSIACLCAINKPSWDNPSRWTLVENIDTGESTDTIGQYVEAYPGESFDLLDDYDDSHYDSVYVYDDADIVISSDSKKMTLGESISARLGSIDLSDYAKLSAVPTKVSELQNDIPYVSGGLILSENSILSDAGYVNNSIIATSIANTNSSGIHTLENFVQFDSSGRFKLCNLLQYAWSLSLFLANTFDPPIDLTFGYYTTVVGKFNSRVVTIYINAYAWVGFYLPDSRNRYPIVIRSFNQDPETAYSRADVTLSTVSYISSNRSNTDFTANFSNVSDYKNLSSLTRIDTGEVVTFNASRTDKWPNLQINEFAYLSNLNDVLHLSGGTMTGSIEFDGGTDVDDILDYIKISIPGDLTYNLGDAVYKKEDVYNINEIDSKFNAVNDQISDLSTILHNLLINIQ